MGGVECAAAGRFAPLVVFECSVVELYVAYPYVGDCALHATAVARKLVKQELYVERCTGLFAVERNKRSAHNEGVYPYIATHKRSGRDVCGYLGDTYCGVALFVLHKNLLEHNFVELLHPDTAHAYGQLCALLHIVRDVVGHTVLCGIEAKE